ncbi:MAG TPA: hypothetical protein DHW02_19875 [Ktedonobacter sp.]|nr:hypothetical protein [Ktedonobacter sp.]
MQRKYHFQHLMGGLCAVALLLLFTACQWTSGPQNTTSTPTPLPTPTFTPTPTPSPTPIVATLKTYTGNGYTIDYPKGWTASIGSDNIVSFTDPTGLLSMTITVQSNAQGATGSTDLVDNALQVFKTQASNFQQLNVASTATIGSETWSQGAATGDVPVTGQVAPVTMKNVVIADNHPTASSTTMAYTISYSAGVQDFHLYDQGYFQPMLQSFAFTS